ncbi:hypothetical protein F4811DRAFT_568573 [Daldinia bambusicola]|nr:hypothetical protein F4811DRAFT_568573 [Daldinia bambusicola]
MDTSSSHLINPDDPDHPLVHLSKQNEDESPFFKKLVLEVRIMIYEFAVAMDDVLKPVQRVPRSNKFILEGSSNTPSTVVHLGRTCRRIYQELENFPVFYRVNTFQFRMDFDMHIFLAAIHPKRLGMIRTVRLRFGDIFYNEYDAHDDPWYGQSPTIKYILALLSQCTSLEDLSLVLQQNTPRDLTHFLSGWERLARKSPSIPAFINLPVFKIFLRYQDQGPEYTLEEALSHSQLIQTEPTKKILADVDYGLRARKAIFARLPKVTINHKTDYRPQWLRDMADGTAINEAIKAAPIDFPGHKRIAQDVRDMSDTVSSRTRRKSMTVNEHGVVYREIPQFNVDGLLAWKFNEVKGVRWDDSGEVELEVKWCWPPRVPATSWVPFESFEMNREGEEMIIAFYRKDMDHSPYRSNLESHIQRMKSMPSLSDIAEIAGGVDYFLNKYAPTVGLRTGGSKKARFRAWAHWIKAWDNCIATTENNLKKQKKEAAEAEAFQAAEDAARAAQAEKAAKKAARKAARAAKAAKVQEAANKKVAKAAKTNKGVKAAKVTKAKSIKTKSVKTKKTAK